MEITLASARWQALIDKADPDLIEFDVTFVDDGAIAFDKADEALV
jgi:hypothetical protein